MLPELESKAKACGPDVNEVDSLRIGLEINMLNRLMPNAVQGLTFSPCCPCEGGSCDDKLAAK